MTITELLDQLENCQDAISRCKEGSRQYRMLKQMEADIRKDIDEFYYK